MLQIVCVLRTGGVYDLDYVHRLSVGVRRHCTHPYEFICLTDLLVPSTQEIAFRPLVYAYPGWWSKLEVFSLRGPAIYFDLDTVITGSIDPFARAVTRKLNTIYMLRPFRRLEAWASGIMGWQGDWSWLLNDFQPEWMQEFVWDQRYLSNALHSQGVQPQAVQDFLPGVYSFKHHCREALPSDASVVCFHGRPRPHQVHREWMQ